VEGQIPNGFQYIPAGSTDFFLVNYDYFHNDYTAKTPILQNRDKRIQLCHIFSTADDFVAAKNELLTMAVPRSPEARRTNRKATWI